MADNKEFKDALWDAIEGVFYEFNGKRGERFGLEDVKEALKDHSRFFDVDDDFEDEEISYDPDAEEARKFMPGGEYDESDDDIYYDPIDGYRDTEGFHNSIEEAEDDFYENDYKPNIPEDDE